ncbi:hydroxyacid dehydrogenase [Xylophilus rhododendri]|uniref:Hydroxyacid dehydrogenase n=1 Tax=Xylophilus rhododendri TaxID=2697032 RepID=A0A857J5T6_9BURK|nr:NAD(P)-dependent oxidoreductase [Xylophilus rhododendri]QHI98459.1 hydroxyacid dehydrogenase [Xylophilus rhododendri]
MASVFLTHTAQERHNYYGDAPLAALRTHALVVLNDSDRPPSAAELIAKARDCDIIVSARSVAAPAEVFDALPKLRAFCRVAVDIRNIDVEAASRKGVLVTRATPGFDASVSEWIVGTMIDLSRGIGRMSAQYQAGLTPEVRMGAQLKGATLGIIGYGFIGQYLATIAQALGLQVLVADPFVTLQQTPSLRSATLDSLLKTADYVACLAAALPETHHLIDAAALAKMRPSAFLINASRAELIDEAALLAALDAGRIAGAALDVGSAADQMPPLSLAAHPRVIASPHIGGLTPAATQHQAMDTVRQVAAIVAGQLPQHCVNADRIGRLATSA